MTKKYCVKKKNNGKIPIRKVKFLSKNSIFTSFSPKKIGNFLGKSKWNFWTKNEDFEQCERIMILLIFQLRKNQ